MDKNDHQAPPAPPNAPVPTSALLRGWRAIASRFPVLSLAGKIILPLLITLVALGVVGRIGYFALLKQRAALNRELAAYATGIERASALPNNLVVVRAGLYKLSVWGMARRPSDDLTALKKQIHESVGNAEASLALLEKEGVDQVETVRPLFDRYAKAVDQALALIDRSPIVGATATRGLEQLYVELAAAGERLANAAARQFEAKTHAANEDATRIVERFAALAILLFGTSTLFGVLVAFQISRPIKDLVQSIGALQRGERNVAVPYRERSDEIGSVARALGDFAVSLEARRELESELRAQKDQALEHAAAAEAASLAKSSFLANVSHEIRTPLNGILGMAQFLEDQAPTNKQRESVETILESGKTLMAILNDVLDLSKIEAGKLKIERTQANLHELFLHLQRLFAARAQEKSIALSVRIDDSVPEVAIFDQIRVGQCVSNLLSNAIKFTHAGSVAVSVTQEALESGEHLISVAVTDTGIGISEEAAGRLFSEFSQADHSTTREYGGTGLGLAIARKLARLMDGDIRVISEPGAGSTFTFTFQASVERPSETTRTPASKEDHNGAALQGVRVLLVDDNPINRNVARLLLAPTGAVTTEAANGKQALERLVAQPFDVVLLDVHMPIMDGPETIRRIRAAKEPWRETPVIALTAEAMGGDRERLLTIGMDGYASKPIEQATLVSEIQRVTGGNANAATAEGRNASRRRPRKSAKKTR